MKIETIKFKTIQFVNGITYLSKEQVEQVKNIMCYNLKIEKTEDNLKAVEDGLKTYFTAQNSRILV